MENELQDEKHPGSEGRKGEIDIVSYRPEAKGDCRAKHGQSHDRGLETADHEN